MADSTPVELPSIGETVPEQLPGDALCCDEDVGSALRPSGIPAAATEFPQIVSALRNPDFRAFWSGNFLSNIGTWMQNVAQGWLVLQLTNSSFWLGIIGFAASLPYLLFTLFGGVIADRVDKRKLLLTTQSAMMVLAFIMAALTHWKIISVGQISLLAFLTGVAMALNAPSYQATVPQLVPREDLSNAIALNSAQFHLSRIVGPTLGGFAMAWVGIAGNFFINGCSFLAVIFAILRIKYPPRAPRRNESIWVSLRAGLLYVYEDRQMFAVVTLAMVLSFFAMPFLTFIPYFAKNILHADERGLGLLMACSGAGALAGALTLAGTRHLRRRGLLLVCCAVVGLSANIVFCYSRVFAISAVTQVFEGYFMIMMIAPINVVMQELSSDEMRGRVMSINATSFLGLPPFGCLLAGVLSRHIPLQHAIAGMLVAVILFYIFFYLNSESLQHLD